MRPLSAALLAIALLALPFPAEAAQKRSQAVLREFRATHVCPSTGRLGAPCPGYQIDHIFALECGGPDAVYNLHYLSVEMHARKTKIDNARCGKARRP